MSALSGPLLRVHYGEEEREQDARAEQLLIREPRLAWRARDFFENWSLPQVLKTRKRATGTIEGYENTLRYWEQITDDPRLVDLLLDDDDKQTIDFVGTLPEWGYSRRGMRRGEPIRIGPLSANPSFTSLELTTVSAHATRMATLLRQAGPQYEMRSRVARLLDRRVYVPPVEHDFQPKPPFELGVARQIAGATSRMARPALPSWLPCELWWKTRLALFYFTGLRAGTVVALARPHVERRKTGLWLNVPRSLVKKTKKPIELVVHPQLAELIDEVEARRPSDAAPSDLLLPAGCGYRNFLDLHVDLQKHAGLSAEEIQSPHAWRRTHLTQIADLGAPQRIECARLAGDHSDGRTTEHHYLPTLVNQLRLRLPPLFK